MIKEKPGRYCPARLYLIFDLLLIVALDLT